MTKQPLLDLSDKDLIQTAFDLIYPRDDTDPDDKADELTWLETLDDYLNYKWLDYTDRKHLVNAIRTYSKETL